MAWTALAGALLLYAGAAWAEGQSDLDGQLDRAWACTERATVYNDGLAIAEKVLADPAATPKQKLSAFEVMLTIRGKQRRAPDITELARRMIASFPDDAGVLARAALAEAEVLWQNARTRADALAGLEAALPRLAADKPAAARVQARLARMFSESGKHDRAYEAGKAALDSGTLTDDQAANVLRDMSDAAWGAGDMARCEQAVAAILQDRYSQTLQEWDRNAQYDRYGQVLKRLGKYKEAGRFYRKLAEAEKDPKRAQRYEILIGDLALDAKDYQTALADYERTFTDHGDVTEHWYDAQGRIVGALRAKGDFEGALKAARICIDAAWDSGKLQSAVQTAAETLKAVDGHVARANALILFQKFGPAGEDGASGTADDPSDPLVDVGYPSCEARRKALERACKAAGDDAYAWRFRALAALYTGRPKDALRHYLDALARSTMDEFGRIGQEAVVVGARAVQGHAHNLGRFCDFINYGPAGKDGRTGTPDDQADPFGEWGVRPSGAAAELSPEDAAALRKVRLILREMALRDLEPSDVRHDALAALMRVQLALGEWPADVGPQWCLDQFLRRPQDGRHVTAWLSAGQLAARGGGYHLGGVREFWRKHDGLDVVRDNREHRDVNRLRQELLRTTSPFEDFRPILPRNLRTFSLLSAGVDLPGLRPLPEDRNRPASSSAGR